MRTALVCIAKDEDNCLREWFEFHHSLGFDEIFIYENDWRFKEAVPGYVHLIPFDGKTMQLKAYNTFIQQHSKDFDWALFIDVDEFLFPGNKNKTAKDMFAQFSEHFGLALNWKVFGSSGLEDRDRSFPVIKSFTRSQAGFNKHVKTAVHLSKVIESFGNADDVRFVNPHFVGVASRAYFTIRADMMKHVLGPWSSVDEHTASVWDGPWLAHYAVKSRAEFLERRMKPRADTGQLREDLDGFWKEHDLNEVENLDMLRQMQT